MSENYWNETDWEIAEEYDNMYDDCDNQKKRRNRKSEEK